MNRHGAIERLRPTTSRPSKPTTCFLLNGGEDSVILGLAGGKRVRMWASGGGLVHLGPGPSSYSNIDRVRSAPGATPGSVSPGLAQTNARPLALRRTGPT